MNDAALLGQEQLLQRAKRGDVEAFESLYVLLESDITRYVRRIVSHPQDTADVVQESFIALYTHLQAVESWSHLRPYAYRIARNTAYDLLRQRGRVDEVGIGHDGDDLPPIGYAFHLSDDAPAPEEITHWMLMWIEVQNALHLLPDVQREALTLFTEGDMSYSEIAQVTGVSVGTVKSRIFHAKKTLRGLVRPEILIAMQDAPPRTLTHNTDESEKDNTHATGTATETLALPEGAQSAAKIAGRLA